jgi:hypothetical protein
MNRHELGKVVLDQIERKREQLVRVVVIRTEERKSGLGQCEQCELLWKAYQKATIRSVPIDGEIRSRTEGQGREKLSEATTKAEAAEWLRVNARQKPAQHQVEMGVGDAQKYPLLSGGYSYRDNEPDA